MARRTAHETAYRNAVKAAQRGTGTFADAAHHARTMSAQAVDNPAMRQHYHDQAARFDQMHAAGLHNINREIRETRQQIRETRGAIASLDREAGMARGRHLGFGVTRAMATEARASRGRTHAPEPEVSRTHTSTGRPTFAVPSIAQSRAQSPAYRAAATDAATAAAYAEKYTRTAESHRSAAAAHRHAGSLDPAMRAAHEEQAQWHESEASRIGRHTPQHPAQAAERHDPRGPRSLAVPSRPSLEERRAAAREAHPQHALKRGAKGGMYYIGPGGRKVYVKG